MSTSQLQDITKLVAFQLNDEYYSIDVHKVKEVFVPEAITPIPQADEYTAGVINFRGTIVTVIDLKKRLKIKSKAKEGYNADRNYILIVEINKSTIGILVDYVEAVISVPQTNIQESIEMISEKSKSAFIEGIAQTDLGLVIILALDVIFTEYDLSELEKLAAAREQISAQRGDIGDEITVTSQDMDTVSTMTDFSIDDLDEAEDVIIGDEGFKRVPASKPAQSPKKQAAKKEADEFGDSPLDLNQLTKAELLRIAVEMGIDSVSTKSKKDELISAIQKQMGM